MAAPAGQNRPTIGIAPALPLIQFPAMQNSIHLVGGEKGGVGKSTFSRLLAQYFIDRQLPFAGLDTDRSHQSFVRFYADFTEHLDVDDFEGLDQIVEAALAEPDRQVVVDLAAQSARPLWSWLDDADVIELLEESHIRLVCWHLLDDSRDSSDMLAELLEHFGKSAQCVAVLNRGRGRDFDVFERSGLRQRLHKLGGKVVELPKLHHASMAKIDLCDASFWAAAHNPAIGNLTMMDRQRCKIWLRRAVEVIEKGLEPGTPQPPEGDWKAISS